MSLCGHARVDPPCALQYRARGDDRADRGAHTVHAMPRNRAC